MKYKKKQNQKEYKFGDYVKDYGKFLTDSALAPFEGLTGKDLVDTGEYNNKKLGQVGDTLTGLKGQLTSTALNVAVPGLGTAAKGVGNTIGNQLNDVEDLQSQPGVDAGANLLNNAIPMMMSQGGSLTEYMSGGTHEQNPNGGIAIGNNASVEEGETRDSDYIFSNRLMVNETLANEFNLPKKAIGKSFADVSKMFNDKDRPNDSISNRGYKKEIENLKKAQEAFKEVELNNQPTQQFRDGGELNLNSLEKHQRQMESSIMNPLLYNDGFSDNIDTYGTLLNKSMNLPEVTVTGEAPTSSTRTKESIVDLPNKLDSDRSVIDTSNQIGNNALKSKNDDGEGSEDGNNYASLMRYAPIASNIGSLISELNDKPSPKQASKFQTDVNFEENLIGDEGVRRDIESSGNAIRDSLEKNVSSAGALAGNLLGTDLNTKNALSKAGISIDRLNNAEKARVQQSNFRQDARNNQVAMTIENMNDQDRAVYKDRILSLIAELGNNAGALGKEQFNMEMLKEMPIGYLMNLLGNVSYQGKPSKDGE